MFLHLLRLFPEENRLKLRVGIQLAEAGINPAHVMKKNLKKAHRSANLSLGDLILAVSACSKNNHETVAAVADLLESGRVRLNADGRKVRARVY